MAFGNPEVWVGICLDVCRGVICLNTGFEFEHHLPDIQCADKDQIYDLSPKMLTFENHAAYMAAKAGTDHLVRIAALEYGRRNIRVNSVSPGFTDTPMTNALLGIAGFRDAFEKEIPLGRLSTIEDVAAATAWVCCDEAYMTGQNLQINGGLSLRRLPTMKELGLT